MPAISFNSARFLKSASTVDALPAETTAEVAFGGRSNAGKSSALNTLTNQKKLARTSKTPGRTQLINVFPINETQSLIDLPGYGFAKVPEAMRAGWGQLIGKYLEEREALKGLILLMDIRHPLKDSDVMMIDWAVENSLPVHCLLTKADKMSRGAANNQLFAVRKELPDGATAQVFSSLKGTGLDEANEVISAWLTDAWLDEAEDSSN